MHEASVVQSLFENADEIRRQHGMRSVSLVRVRVGALQHIVNEVMQTYFDLRREDWPAFAQARLEIMRLPAVLRCLDCGHETELDEPVFACGQCCSRHTELRSGMELDLMSLQGETDD